MARYFRIAASGFFVVLAIAFVALWVRSHFYIDTLMAPLTKSRFLFVNSASGSILCEAASGNLTRWGTTSATWPPYVAMERRNFRKSFELSRKGNNIYIVLPYWFLAVLSLTLAALFAFKSTWRFTTRGLLIATTVVAALLGLAVYVV